jgi:hypothetical protein
VPPRRFPHFTKIAFNETVVLLLLLLLLLLLSIADALTFPPPAVPPRHVLQTRARAEPPDAGLD